MSLSLVIIGPTADGGMRVYFEQDVREGLEKALSGKRFFSKGAALAAALAALDELESDIKTKTTSIT